MDKAENAEEMKGVEETEAYVEGSKDEEEWIDPWKSLVYNIE